MAEVYGGSAALVFLLALLVLLARPRRLRPVERGYRLPRLAVAVLLTVTGALLWLGLPFGIRVPMLATVPFTAAVLMEVTARTRG